MPIPPRTTPAMTALSTGRSPSLVEIQRTPAPNAWKSHPAHAPMSMMGTIHAISWIETSISVKRGSPKPLPTRVLRSVKTPSAPAIESR